MKKGRHIDRNHHLAMFAVWLGIVVGIQGVALSAQKTPKPLVMLLLDTSGSMEYSVTELDEEGVVPTCHDTRQTGFSYEKSRWVVASEVLTGSFHDFWCSWDFRDADSTREDYMYPVPHIVAHGTEVDGSIQRSDGLLDLFRDSIKFGLMTFDSRLGAGSDLEGGYSYATTRNWGGFSINLGARNEGAPWGAFVPPPVDDDLEEIQDANDAIQLQILGSTPYLGTPIAPLLEDAYYFFESDPRGRAYDEATGQGDPYYDCRSKNIILITDGQPTLGEGTYGYGLSESAAAQLAAAGVKVYVVGFQMPQTTFPILNSIALAGGTDEAYIVSSQVELNGALGEILVEIQGNSTSQVQTAITNRTMNNEDLQYQFNASYGGTTVSPLDLVGHLDQYVYRCDAECASEEWDGGAALCEVLSISDALAQRTTARNIWTQLEGELQSFATDNDALTPGVLGVATSGELPRLAPYVNTDGTITYSGLVLGDASVESVREEYRNQLISLVSASSGSRRSGIPLGAIVHSQPVLQQNLFTVSAPIPSFIQYRNLESVRTRPTALFVGTHDGQIHCFDVSRDSSSTSGTTDFSDIGKELWSFIPKHLLPQLNRLASGAAFLLDGSPVVQEVRLYKRDVQAGLEEETALWRSVLLVGYREGGRGYVALDVTDPVNPAFMWEISNTERCFDVDGNSTCETTSDFQRLGNSYGRPAIGTVFWENNGVLEERAVAIFGGGSSIDGESESGRAVFVVNLETGELIREFCNSCGNVEDGNTGVLFNSELLDNPMVGDVAAFETFVGGLVTRAFIGDSGGQLWRLNLLSSDPQDWKLEFFHDAYTILPPQHVWRRPIMIRPSLATSASNGQVTVIYGTGDPDAVLRPGWGDRVYSLTEFWNGSAFVARVNWQLHLEEGESFGSEALVFNQVAYFTTQTSGGGLCDIGVGRLWGIDYDGDDPNQVNDIVARLDEDGDPTTQALVAYNTYEDSELVGVQLVQRPACFAQATDFEPWNSASPTGTNAPQAGEATSQSGAGTAFQGTSGGNLELVVQTGSTGASSPQMQAPEGGGTSQTGNKAVLSVARPSRSVFSMSWGLVFD